MISAGIIPARAGFTRASSCANLGPMDHPRSRGVYPPLCLVVAACVGSSPLARGLLHRDGVAAYLYRIIPARAGFTPSVSAHRRERRDHPRSRGVYILPRLSPRTIRGSSPLARGLLIGEKEPCTARGIIPARAGFTYMRRRGARRSRDHPRSRGVYTIRTAQKNYDRGSSPLARGLPREAYYDVVAQGIIPARAGFTSTGCLCSSQTGDHPRSRGVYLVFTVTSWVVRGSSPLARGLLYA